MAKDKFTASTNINFVGLAPFGIAISFILIAASIYIWIEKGPDKYGVDFLGGAEIVAHFNEPTTAAEIRKALEANEISGSIVQKFETVVEDEERYEYSIKVKATSDSKESDKIVAALNTIDGRTFEILKQDYVGPIIGEQIRTDGLKALIGAVLCILIYVSFRFEWRFAVGAILALVHDVLITCGLYLYTGGEISVAVLAALLTIIGYSLNDTIVILDRVRENITEALRNGGKDARRKVSERLGDILNNSLNQTLSRTIITTLTTFFVVLALWLFGGGALTDLALTLVFGVVIGAYSTVFVVTPVVLYLKR